ncbi:MAG: FKBP-type peptidyl-prolyl cis-trans isomerase [Bacteroidota bacterium]
MKKIILGFVALAMFGIVGCSKYPGYKKTDNGLYYKVDKKGASDVMPKEGDVVLVEILCKTEKGSIFFDTRKEPVPSYVPVSAFKYKGDMAEAFWLFAAGDSGSFIVPVDTLTKHGQFQLPDSLKGQLFYFSIRVDSLIPKAEWEKRISQFQKQQAEASQNMAKTENDNLQLYLTENKITATPTASGLYIITTKKGTGKKASSNSTVVVNYTGSLLDGKVFDTSVKSVAEKFNILNPNRKYEPFPVNLGKGEVIPGWDEALATMSVGQKAKLIIPSKLGYGERAMGEMIPAFSTLVFEVEVLDVK